MLLNTDKISIAAIQQDDGKAERYEVLSLPQPQGKINLAMLSLYTAYVDLALGTSNLNDTFLTRHALRFPPRQRWVGTKRAKIVIIYKITQLLLYKM